MMFLSYNRGTPKSSIDFNRIFHYKPLLGYPIYGNPHELRPGNRQEQGRQVIHGQTPLDLGRELRLQMAMGQQFEPQGSDLMVRLLMSPIIPIHWYKLVYTVLSSTQMVTVSFIQLRPDPFVHLSFNFPNKVTPKHGN